MIVELSLNIIIPRHIFKKHNIQNNNGKVKHIKCQKCDKKFTLEKNMVRHMKTLPSEEINEPNNLSSKVNLIFF